MKPSAYFMVLITIALLSGLPCRAQWSAKQDDITWDKPAASWPAAKMTLGSAATIVDDPAATTGTAVAAIAGKGRACHLISGGWLPCNANTAYEAAFRMRLEWHPVSPADLPMPIPISRFDTAGTGVSHRSWSVRLELVHRPTPQDAAHESVIKWAVIQMDGELKNYTQYHDYLIASERPMPGYLGVKAYWYGRGFCSTWIDTVHVKATPLPSESELLQNTPAPTLTINHQQPRTLAVLGVYHWTYRLPELIGGPCDVVWLADDLVKAKSGAKLFPTDAAELAKYDTIVFVDSNLLALTPQQRQLLAAYLQAGGGALFLGGPYGFGKSTVHISPLLMDLLPVKTLGLWDMRKAPGRGLTLSAATSRLARLDWGAKPRVYYYHETQVKPDAEVWVTGNAAGQQVPLLVARKYGNGLVAAFTGTPFGEMQKGETAVWAWKDWGRLVNITLNAMRGRRGRKASSRRCGSLIPSRLSRACRNRPNARIPNQSTRR